jgi:hypothetical protein
MRSDTCIMAAFAAGAWSSPIPGGVLSDITPSEQAPEACSVNHARNFGIFALPVIPDSKDLMESEPEQHDNNPLLEILKEAAEKTPSPHE